MELLVAVAGLSGQANYRGRRETGPRGSCIFTKGFALYLLRGRAPGKDWKQGCGVVRFPFGGIFLAEYMGWEGTTGV